MMAQPRTPMMPPLGAALLAVAALTTTIVFAITVWPALSGAVRPVHAGHWGWVLLHALAGTAMIVTGPLNLYVGQTRRGFEWHRHIGCVYLGAGYTAVIAALALNWQDPHRDPAVALATSTLALSWAAVATMAWREAVRGRVASHRDWMIRSYVLTWTFVFCRLVMQTPLPARLGDNGVALTIWLTWLVPALLCEVALRGRVARAR
jgi:hypothetical protein